MGKKSFEKNPAMLFISEESVNAVENTEQPKVDAPAVNNIPGQDAQPLGYVLKPESKTKRVQLLVQPSVYEQLKNLAAVSGISVNEAINEAIRLYVGGNK